MRGGMFSKVHKNIIKERARLRYITITRIMDRELGRDITNTNILFKQFLPFFINIKDVNVMAEYPSEAPAASKKFLVKIYYMYCKTNKDIVNDKSDHTVTLKEGASIVIRITKNGTTTCDLSLDPTLVNETIIISKKHNTKSENSVTNTNTSALANVAEWGFSPEGPSF